MMDKMEERLFTVFNQILGGNPQEECSRISDDIFRGACEVLTNIAPELSGIKQSRENLQVTDTESIGHIIRLRSEKKLCSNNPGLSVDAPDYLPISFLERGLRCSAAVCIIRRQFTLKELSERLDSKRLKDFPTIIEALITQGFKTINKDNNDPRLLSDIIKQEIKQKNIQEDLLLLVPFATGFLVGPEHLITNYHVFFDDENQKELNPKRINQFVAEFGYERNAAGIDRKPRQYTFDSIDEHHEKSQGLDYILIKLNYPNLEYEKETSPPGEIFGWLPMHDNPHLVMPYCNIDKMKKNDLDAKLLGRRAEIPGDPVFIIQHPRGRKKEIVLFNNQVDELYKDFFQYQADADFGSSGSPVLSRDWKLVGLHHASLIQYDNNDITVIGNLGVRISQIFADLKNSKKDWIKTFIDKHTVQKDNTLPLSNVFISIGRDRQDFLGSEKGKLELRVMEALKKELENILPNSEQSGIRFEFIEKFKTINEQIDSINSKGYRLGDVAIEIVMDAPEGEKTKSDETTTSISKESSKISASLYYSGYLIDRRSHAEIIMQAIRAQVPEILNRGINSDLTSGSGSIGFCSRVHMPSLVLFLGNMDDPENIIFIEENKEKIAIGLLDGVTAWVKTLSPYGFW